MSSKLPPEIRARLREWGAGADPALNQNSKALFAPLQAPAAGVTQELDIPFGADARQKLDVYHVADGKTGKTIVIYIPGGGFTGGDKRQDDNYFGNVCRFFARQGMVGVAANYRLAPDFKWPCAGQDLQKLLSAFAVGGDSGLPRRSAEGAKAGPCGHCGDPRGPGSCSIH